MKSYKPCVRTAVRNGTGLWRESERWQVVEEFRVGSLWGKNPDAELRSATNNSVTLGPNGQIFVMEYAADRGRGGGGPAAEARVEEGQALGND